MKNLKKYNKNIIVKHNIAVWHYLAYLTIENLDLKAVNIIVENTGKDYSYIIRIEDGKDYRFTTFTSAFKFLTELNGKQFTPFIIKNILEIHADIIKSIEKQNKKYTQEG